MSEALATSTLAWVLTYLFHSTLLLTAAALAARLLPAAAHRLRDGLWKLALVGGLATATLQLSFGLTPAALRVVLDRDAALLAAPATAAAPQALLRIEAQAGIRSPGPAGSAAPGAERSGEAALAVLLRSRSGATGAQPLGGAPGDPFHAGAEGLASSVAAAAHAPESAAAAARPFAPAWVMALWLAALLVGAVRSVNGHRRLRQLLAGRRQLTSGRELEWLAELSERAGLRRAPKLSTSDELTSPVSFGCLRPEICVPTRALTELGRAEWRALLGHEVAHVRRRDPLWLELCRWLETLLVVQPLNGVARRGIEREAEFLCDAWAVRWTGAPLGLARCLTRVADWVVGDRTPALPVTPMAAPGSQLGQRVERLIAAAQSAAPAPRRSLGFPALALAVVGGLSLAAPGVVAGTQPQSSGDPIEPSGDAPPLEAVPPSAAELLNLAPPRDKQAKTLVPTSDAPTPILLRSAPRPREAAPAPETEIARSIELLTELLLDVEAETSQLSAQVDAMLQVGAEIEAGAEFSSRLATIRARLQRMDARGSELGALLAQLRDSL